MRQKGDKWGRRKNLDGGRLKNATPKDRRCLKKMNMNGFGGGFTIPAYVFLEDRRTQIERAIQFAEEEKRKRLDKEKK